MDWREQCGEKLVTPERALEIVQPTDRVFIAGLQSTPFTLCRALIEKKQELRGLRLNTLVSFFPWDAPGLEEYFHLESRIFHAGALPRCGPDQRYCLRLTLP